MSACIETLRRLAGEYRAREENRRNGERLRRWRVRYWTLTGIWPDESARLTQTLAGWPRGHRGAWPKFTTHKLADVLSLVDRRNRDRNPTEAT